MDLPPLDTMKYQAHGYQQYAAQRIVDNAACGLFLDMGLGKTVVTLTAIDELINDRFEVSRVLVIAPLRVASDTWPREAAKWEHLQHLRVARVLGTAKQRRDALREDADIYLINRENVPWLVAEHAKKPWPFDMVVIDELSSFKSPSAARFRALRKVMPYVNRRVGLTGTPAPNGYVDLWSQIYLLDTGARLGKTVTGYKDSYFHPAIIDRHTGVVFRWDLNTGAKERIDEKLQDLCISMTAKDYIDMPERVDVSTLVELTTAQRAEYDRLERDYLLQLADSDNVVTAGTAAAITGKLQQFSQGAVYITDPERPEVKDQWGELHQAKLEAMDDIIEAANGKPVLVFYWYKHDLSRLTERYPKARSLDTSKDIDDWNNGSIPVLLVHPASAGHGLNLQTGGNHVVWFSLPWSLELYQQANARIFRQGQPEARVIIQHLLVRGTVDEDILAALQTKNVGQAALIEALKARIQMARSGQKEAAE